VDSVPDPLLLRKSGSAENQTRTSGPAARNSDHWTTEAVTVALMRGDLIDKLTATKLVNTFLLSRGIQMFTEVSARMKHQLHILSSVNQFNNFHTPKNK
jgi:hypothetical protein